jgi:hypothetical protein
MLKKSRRRAVKLREMAERGVKHSGVVRNWLNLKRKKKRKNQLQKLSQSISQSKRKRKERRVVKK